MKREIEQLLGLFETAWIDGQEKPFANERQACAHYDRCDDAYRSLMKATGFGFGVGLDLDTSPSGILEQFLWDLMPRFNIVVDGDFDDAKAVNAAVDQIHNPWTTPLLSPAELRCLREIADAQPKEWWTVKEVVESPLFHAITNRRQLQLSAQKSVERWSGQVLKRRKRDKEPQEFHFSAIVLCIRYLNREKK